MDTEFWALDPATTHLNHGSFGATPRPVLDAQAAWRMQMESNPVRFMEDVLPGALLAAAHRLAGHVGADPAGLVFVPNATAGVNAALRSLEPDLERGDEILITDHAYNACANAVRVTAERTGAKVAVATVPFPLDGPDSVISAITAAARSRTAVVVIDQVTSPTGLVFPVAELVAEFEPDVTVIVDGAHAPGMLPLAVDALGASYYAGNCHKWLCAPKGAGFLVARPDRRERTIPPVISHGWNRPWPGLDRYRSMFGWTGTGDPTAFLSVPVALDAMAGRFGGWEAIMAANHALAVEGRELLLEALGLPAPAPTSMLGSLAALPLPLPTVDGPDDPLTRRLRDEHRIEVPVSGWAANRLLRVSAQRYNQLDDYERLAGSLMACLGG